MYSVRARLLCPLLVLPLACAGHEQRAISPEHGDPCELIEEAATAAHDETPVIVALHDRVDPSHAPRAHNPAERFVFTQVYETVVRLDCRGRVVPALAESWTRSPDGRAWVFTLRAGATFHDGTPLTASHVAESWTAPAGAEGRVVAILSIAVLGDRALRVELSTRTDTAPALFANVALAVHKPAAGLTWPYGTGPYRPSDSTRSGDQQFPRTLLLEPAPRADQPGVHATRLPPPLEFRIASDPDSRNSLDAGADVLITTDAAVISYAASDPVFTLAPLPWDVSYALVTPAGTAAGASGSPGDDDAAAARSLREQLARDAVPGAARPAQPLWADNAVLREGLRCTPAQATTPPSTAAPRTNRIVYPRSDRAARGLAERLVALARASRPEEGWLLDRLGGSAAASRMVTVGLTPAAFAAALRTGAERAYVVPIPHRSNDACAELGYTADIGVLPLVDTRPTAILRRGIAGVIVDGSGVLLFERARWTTAR